MSEQTVTLIVKNNVALPKSIVLPMPLVSKYRIERELIIPRSQRQLKLPEAVAKWLLQDARYRNWFEVEKPKATSEPNKTKPKTEPKQQPKSNPRSNQNKSKGGAAK